MLEFKYSFIKKWKIPLMCYLHPPPNWKHYERMYTLRSYFCKMLVFKQLHDDIKFNDIFQCFWAFKALIETLGEFQLQIWL